MGGTCADVWICESKCSDGQSSMLVIQEGKSGRIIVKEDGENCR